MQPYPYVITGGGSGIGQALAWQLAEQGEHVVVIGRRKEALAATSRRFPDQISMISADVSHEAGRDHIAQQLRSYAGIKALIHAAVNILPLVRVGDMSLATWHNTQAVNVDPLVFLTQRLLPQLKNARVVLFSSSMGRVAAPYLASYCADKAVVPMLYQCFNHDFKQFQVHTGCVSPGIVDTPVYAAVVEAMHSPAIDPNVRLAYLAFLAKNPPLPPSVVACFLRWLLCEADVGTFTAHEWDISDPSHHPHWVKGFAAPKPLDFSA